MQLDKEIQKNWLRVNPLENPILKDPPKHQPEKFNEYVELKDEEKVVGFLVNQQSYFFYEDGGWRDENGCYYDKDGQPDGWFVLHPGNDNHEHYYDQDGMYVPTDVENEKNSIDINQDNEEDSNQSDKDDIQEYEKP
ncbi:unnamed protein product [Paramecium octaurelia]|uniref:Uncharacterized protein n=1 Tax=Paramecium octaurelia TaxID=43137 RepID=A0A8S1SRU6_PAROT|nr:unnamed protein product [Paramecium octaurelia]